MTRARMPRPHEVAIARRDPRLLGAIDERHAGEAWRTRGACRSVDPETFFPAPNEPADGAVALCGTCDVQGPCLAWALQAGDCHGVWGGTSPRERREGRQKSPLSAMARYRQPPISSRSTVRATSPT